MAHIDEEEYRRLKQLKESLKAEEISVLNEIAQTASQQKAIDKFAALLTLAVLGAIIATAGFYVSLTSYNNKPYFYSGTAVFIISGLATMYFLMKVFSIGGLGMYLSEKKKIVDKQKNTV